MRWSFTLGRIAGIRVELHVTFLLFIVWIAITNGLLRGDLTRAATTVALLLLVFVCVLLHELGHALTARRFGIVTRDIVLLPIGGVARLQRMPDRPGQEILVAVAGPAVNIVIAALLLGLMTFLGLSAGEARLGGGILEALFLVNLFMVAFNMIPAFPMDGGRVLRALLALRVPYARATRIASLVGQGIALLFGAFGLFGGHPMLLFVALFVFLAAAEERALVQTRGSLSGLPVRAAMMTEFVRLDVSDPVRRAVDLLIAGSQQDFPVLDGDLPVGVLTRADLLRALQGGDVTRAVGEIVNPEALFADSGEPLEGAVQRMREHNLSALAVRTEGRLVGLLTLENIGDLLLVQDAIRRRRTAT